MKSTKIILAGIAVAVFTVATAFSQTVAPPKKNYDWSSAAFKGEDNKFHQTRVAIDQAFKSDMDIWRKYVRYKHQFKKNDLSTYYGWGYAAYKFASTGVNGLKAIQIQDEVLHAFKKKTLSSSYEFMRMRFLVTAHGAYPQELKPLAERLLNHTAQDYDVQVTYGKILADSPTKSGRSQALAYAEKLARQYPKERGVYGLLGRIYDALWVSKDDPSARAKAIKAYEKYLELTPNTPSNAENRRNAQALLEVARRGK